MLVHLETLQIIAQIALRNLRASGWKTLIVGGITAFGALLVVLGTSLTDGVDRAMRGSIIGSYAGHIQVYSSESKDDLEVMGRVNAGLQDLTALPDFAQLRAAVGGLPNVKSVVPMGISNALVSSGNTMDQALERLRKSAGKRLLGDTSSELENTYATQKAHVRQILKLLVRDFEQARRIADQHTSTEDLDVMRRASSEEFWSGFERTPYEHLELLENQVSPLASDADVLFLHYLGTDPKEFAQSFDRMTIVDGEPIPEGERGFLFSKYMYEEQVKLKVARGLDKLKQGRDVQKSSIAGDPELQRLVRENSAGVQELLLQLDPTKTQIFQEKLQKFLPSNEPDLSHLLKSFFATTDDNLDARYAFFYRELAPLLQLYRVRIGDPLTITAVTRSGYVRSASLKVYGTFAFKGLEKSPLAGELNIMDLVSFRDLYGFMTADREREIAALREGVGARDIPRESAEQELFGSVQETGSDEVDDSRAGQVGAAPDALQSLAARRHANQNDQQSRYDPAQLKAGVLLNAAVLVYDEEQIAETISAIEQAGKRVGLPLKAVSWHKAAGVLGQLATLMHALLYTAVLIIFFVALVVINNALVMATLERVGELGTLRAIGAQRRFVLAMLLLESVVVGVLAGALGALLGAVILSILGTTGIPAGSDVMTFFFSGPRLYPQLGAPQLAFALAVVLLTSVASSIYPAWLAMRVSPREAMHAED